MKYLLPFIASIGFIRARIFSGIILSGLNCETNGNIVINMKLNCICDFPSHYIHIRGKQMVARGGIYNWGYWNIQIQGHAVDDQLRYKTHTNMSTK